MGLFRCTKCGCIENTALGDYWRDPELAQCSECETGKWHGEFPKRDADEAGYVPCPVIELPNMITAPPQPFLKGE